VATQGLGYQGNLSEENGEGKTYAKAAINNGRAKQIEHWVFPKKGGEETKAGNESNVGGKKKRGSNRSLRGGK